MFSSSMPGVFGTNEPLILLIAAILLEAYIGHPRLGLPVWLHPRRALSLFAHSLRRRLDREERGTEILRLRGLFSAFAVILAGVIGGALLALVTRHYPFAWLLEVAVLVALIDQRGTRDLYRELVAFWERDDLGSARTALGRLSAGALRGPELESLNTHGIALQAQQVLAGRFVTGLIAPAFWFAVAGLPGIMLQQAAWVAASANEALKPDPGPFGRAAGRCHWLIHWPPRLLAALLLAAAAAMTRGVPLRTATGLALRTEPSPEAVMASVTAGSPPGPAALQLTGVAAALAVLLLTAIVALRLL